MDIIQIMTFNHNHMLAIQILHGYHADYGSYWADNGKIPLRNDYDRLYLLEEGQAMVRATDETKWSVMTPGSFYLIPGNEKVRNYKCVKTMRLAWIHFRTEIIPGISLFSQFIPSFSAPASALQASIFFNLINSLNQQPSPRYLSDLLGDLFHLISPFMPDDWDSLFASTETLERLAPALTFIKQNLDKNIDLKTMAKVAALHPTYFTNLFKETLGVTPIQYLKKQRMRRACGLLREKTRSITEVAYACGYEDPLYFSRVFKETLGASPSSYQEHEGIIKP